MKKIWNPKGSMAAVQNDSEPEIDWEMRPGGMLVQMREDEGDGAASSRGPMIKINVAHGQAQHEVFVPT